MARFISTWSPRLFAGFLALTACNGNADHASTTTPAAPAADSIAVAPATEGPAEGKPTGAKPTWAPTITGPMQAVIEKLESFKNPPIPTLTAKEARRLPSPTDAVKKLMREQKIPMPPSEVDTVGVQVNGRLHARIYTPHGATGPLPLIVYFHGGGWVIANLDTYDAGPRALAQKANAVVVSVAYRQAPEHKFPAAHDDAFEAYQWALGNAANLKADPNRVAVAGESAGGNLAAAVSLMARDTKVPLPKYQLLVYPIASYDQNTPSYKQNVQAKPLDKPMMGWFFDQYLRKPADGKDPRIALVSANLKGLPPATIITAEIDPLMSEGKMLADKLKAAGVATEYKNYPGVTHEFFGMNAVLPEARDAQDFAAANLKAALK